MQRHHRTSLQTVDIINDLRAQPDILQELGFPSEHCRIAARQLGVFTGFGAAQRTSPTSASSSAASRARRGSPFSQPDDVFTLNRDLPTLALAWCLSRARCGSWSSDRRSFSVTATRPRPPDEMGCQDGGHSGFEGCARNFCGCQHCCFLLRAGMTASPLSAFKTFMPARFTLEAVDD